MGVNLSQKCIRSGALAPDRICASPNLTMLTRTFQLTESHYSESMLLRIMPHRRSLAQRDATAERDAVRG
jgi:hypothetical protein